jgi:hypothetical protein
MFCLHIFSKCLLFVKPCGIGLLIRHCSLIGTLLPSPQSPLSGIPLYLYYVYQTQIQGLFSTGASIAGSRGCLPYWTISIALVPVVEPRSSPIVLRLSGRVSWKRIRHHESSIRNQSCKRNHRLMQQVLLC